MTGVIVSTPPAVELPPTASGSNPTGLVGVTYVYAIPTVPQTWTATQTFLSGQLVATSPSITTPLGIVKGDVGLGNVDNTSDVNKPVSTATTTALALKANLASPALTGTPTAPTATPGTNTTQLASTAYADAIAALKANLASPTFTGVPAVPTAANGTNTPQIASTAYVQNTVAASGVSSIAGNTGAFTLSNGIDNSTNQIQLTAARRTLPTKQVFLSGSGTYTTPANVLWIEVECVGSGGGGAGGGSGATGAVTAGNNTTFGSALLTASGASSGTVATPGGGGAATGGDVNIAGGGGMGGQSGALASGGNGGGSFFGGAGGGGIFGASGTGAAAAVNSGSGGGGGSTSAATNTGAGGGSGGYVRKIITSPLATYAYAVGAGGAAGGAGTNGTAGGAGGSGMIVVREYYGS